MKKIQIISIFILSMLIGFSSMACTTFFFEKNGTYFVGRNFDFMTGYAHISINKRNLTKNSLVEAPEKIMQWTSKYGSISFNQQGKELPYGGMNEAGLVVEMMWLDDAQYPELDDRYGLTELQWIQYQLDNSASVEEVLASDSLVRVSFQSKAKVHFLVADKSGNVAIIEYLNGKIVVHKKDQMPYKALANDTYSNSLAYVDDIADFKSNNSQTWTSNSLDRFAGAAKRMLNYKNENPIDYAFETLKLVDQNKATQWSIVYDINNQIIHFRTFTNSNIRYLNFSDFDFSCQSPDYFVDIDKNMENEKLVFEQYSYDKNRELIEKVFESVPFMQDIPAPARDYLAAYPEMAVCNEKEKHTVKSINAELAVVLYPKANAETVIMLHGGPGAPNDFVDEIEHIKDNYQVINFDQRGSGNSTCNNCEHTLDEYVSDILNIMAYFKLEKIHLYGHSWGGLYAQIFMEQQPDKVLSAFLSSPSSGTGKHWKKMNKEVMKYNKERCTKEEWREMGKNSFKAARGDNEAMAALYRQVVKNYNKGYIDADTLDNKSANYDKSGGIAANKLKKQIEKADLLKGLENPPFPILITYGDDDIYGETTKYVTDRYPTAKVVFIENCGHLPAIHNPDAYWKLFGEIYK